MTRKELLEVKERYKEQIEKDRARLEGVGLCMEVLHQCYLLGSNLSYNHHERGQRLWAYIEALRELGVTPLGR